MDESSQSSIFDGEITGIRFGLATQKEICTASISDCPISHSSQLTNPFLGLPLEFGKCESCGTSEPGKCEGHFGFIHLPIPIYHPSHISELKRMLSLICLKCLKLKRNKIQIKSNGVAERLLSCCEECAQISIREVKNTDGACFLELKLPSSSRLRDGCWDFLERYGFLYGDDFTRPLLPCEVSRHINFQESRCFYIVSTDDCKQDFSYRKCLENFIRGKYPDLADEFIRKYFARRGNWQRTPAPEGTEEEK